MHYNHRRSFWMNGSRNSREKLHNHDEIIRRGQLLIVSRAWKPINRGCRNLVYYKAKKKCMYKKRVLFSLKKALLCNYTGVGEEEDNVGREITKCALERERERESKYRTRLMESNTQLIIKQMDFNIDVVHRILIFWYLMPLAGTADYQMRPRLHLSLFLECAHTHERRGENCFLPVIISIIIVILQERERERKKKKIKILLVQTALIGDDDDDDEETAEFKFSPFF